MSRNYKFRNPEGLYFISFATVEWMDLFVREVYFGIVVDSIRYCQRNKGMHLYAWCIMPSHIHMVFRSEKADPSGLIRDFKRFTSRALQKAICGNYKESRRHWLLDTMARNGEKRSNVWHYQLWQQHNHPIEVWSHHVIRQKINYIHCNPVVAGFVERPEYWKYSSAADFISDRGLIELSPV